MTVDPRRLCQFEIPAADMRRALAFYENAFGWRPVPAELHEYVVLDVPAECPFGIALVPGKLPEARGGIVPYFAVDDPEAVVAKVEAAGGRKRFGPAPLTGYGMIWRIEDSEGNPLGLYSFTAS